MANDSWMQQQGYDSGGYAPWKVQKNSPGTGWKFTGQTKAGVNIWEYRPGNNKSTPSDPSAGKTSYSSGGGGGGGGGGSSSGDTAKAKADRVAYWTKAYRGATGNYEGKLTKEALGIIAWASANKQIPTATAFLEKLRTDDQVGYLRTDIAQKRRTDIIPTLKDIYKLDWDPNNKEMQALIVKYQLGDQQKLTWPQFFSNYVMKDATFKAKYGDFRDWLKKTGGDPYTAFGDYSKLRKSFTDDYAAKFGAAAVMPADLLAKAIAGNWSLTGKDWQDAIASDTNWGNVTGYGDRIAYFKQQWDSIFKNTPFGAIAPPDDLMKKFGQTTGESQAEFDRLFQTSIRNSTAFKSSFPDFESYAQATFQRTGVRDVGVGDYLTRRADYIERYKALMENADGEPDPTLLATALANNWSNTQWDLTLKKAPEYQKTEAYKSEQSAKLRKGEAFDLNWKRIFGENSTPDSGLRGEFMNGTDTDVNSMWDQIKSTSEFQNQYAQWDTFAKAQNDQGVNVMEDPGLYKQYQTAFNDAFANQGMQAPQGFDRMFFASGIDKDAFANNLAQYGQQAGDYQWQSGQTADLATATGIGDKAAGGDLRKRLDAAIKQHQAYAQSKYTGFQNQQVGEAISQKI